MSQGVAVGDSGVNVGDGGVHVDDDTQECCCGGECVCPIDPWPPVSWPVVVSGTQFKQTYHIAMQYVAFDTPSPTIIRVRETFQGTLTATASPCVWHGLVSYHQTRYDGDGVTVCKETDYNPVGMTLTRETNVCCGWSVVFGVLYIFKRGLDPVGSYGFFENPNGPYGYCDWVCGSPSGAVNYDNKVVYCNVT